jgi:hypothetical protein
MYSVSYSVFYKGLIMDEFKTELIAGLTITLIVLIKAFYTALADKIVKPIISKLGFYKNKLDNKALVSSRIINNLLLELRVKMNSDRAAIFLFHNGQHFNPRIANNSIWKFTCAYETCKAGVTYESHNLQSLMVTNHIDLIQSLWGEMNDGYEKFKCPNCPQDCVKTKNIIVMADISALEYGSTKNILEIQGIKRMIISPIIINEDYVGFVAVSYSSGFNYAEQCVGSNTVINPAGVKTVCEYANSIGYHLSIGK